MVRRETKRERERERENNYRVDASSPVESVSMKMPAQRTTLGNEKTYNVDLGVIVAFVCLMMKICLDSIRAA
jgi:hypothetical protein